MILTLRWTEHAVNQLGAIAEYIGVVSPVYAEQTSTESCCDYGRPKSFPNQVVACPKHPRSTPEN